MAARGASAAAGAAGDRIFNGQSSIQYASYVDAFSQALDAAGFVEDTT